MLKIKLTNLSITNVVARFYLMMAVAIVLGFAELWILMSFLSVAIGASTIMGMSFTFGDNKTAKTTAGKIIYMDWGKGMRKAS